MKSLAERLRSGEPLLGTLLRMPNEVLVEMTALAGMDFVVIDTEHGPADQIPLAQHLMAAAAVGIPALVRIGNVSEILRVLDRHHRPAHLHRRPGGGRGPGGQVPTAW